MILLGHDLEICEWTMRALERRMPTTPYVAIGIVRRGVVMAGCVYENFRFPGIELSFATSSPHWATRQAIAHLLAYPFLQLGCTRITALVDVTNARSQKLAEGVGFIREGLVRQASPTGSDLILYGMLKSECRWLEGLKDGQKLAA